MISTNPFSNSHSKIIYSFASMANIPVRFNGFAAAFNEVAKVGWPCESSGSEHPADLSALVNSFLEREIAEERESHENFEDEDGDGNAINDDEAQINSHEIELKDSLKKLFDDLENDVVGRNIHAAVEKALKEIGGGDGDESLSPEFKRRLMAQLRDRGFDAGLCKSKWEKTSLCSAGYYEYIDINAAGGGGGGNRYIVEIFLAGGFTIARPTSSYDSLLEYFPQIFVGKSDELKQIAKLMSTAIKRSMKSMKIRVPPWRRHVYMQNKWFGLYKRTVKEASSRKGLSIGWNFPAASRTVGFLPVKGVSMHCREDFAAVGGGRIGNLTAALNQ